jgi:hypothetical protein
MEEKIAKIIAFVLHPLFIPFYAILVILNTDLFIAFLLPPKGKLILAGVIFFTTVFLPVSTSYLMIRVKIIHSFFPKERDERIYLLLNMAIFYFLSWYILRAPQVLTIFSHFMMGSAILAAVALFITLFYRISLHMVAAGGLLGGVLEMVLIQGQDLAIPLIMLILLAGLSGYARLKLDPDRPGEVWFGLLTGFAGMFLLFLAP